MRMMKVMKLMGIRRETKTIEMATAAGATRMLKTMARRTRMRTMRITKMMTINMMKWMRT